MLSLGMAPISAKASPISCHRPLAKANGNIKHPVPRFTTGT
jgi:hypothetical protein